MTKYTEIQGSTAFLTELETEINQIQETIDTIKLQKVELNTGLEALISDFTITGLTEKQTKKSELLIVEEALDEANKVKENWLASNCERVIEEAKTIVESHKAKVSISYKIYSTEIIKRVIEIRKIYSELLNEELKERQQVETFLDQAATYLPKEFPDGKYQSLNNHTPDSILSGFGRLNLLKVSPYHYGIQGLFQSTGDAEQNKRFNIVPSEILTPEVTIDTEAI